MNVFNQLKQQLSEQCRTISSCGEFIQIHAQVALENRDFSLLAWLKAQPHYPQFFWQQRENSLTLAAAGCVERFNSLAEAQDFTQKHQLQLVGGLTFNSQAHFILPRLQFAKFETVLTACITLKKAEIAHFSDFLQDFAQISPLSLETNPEISRTQACDFARWTNNIHCAIAAIKQQQFNKAVLANATQLHFAHTLCAHSLLAKSQQLNPHCYHFLWAENAETAFIGSSPERLYARQKQRLYTEALAGTVAVSRNEAENQRNAQWLLHDLKNSYENWLVVEDIQENLLELVSEIDVSSLQVKRLNLVQHLYRNIEALLEAQTQDNHCLAHLHPTAAVAGIPYEPALAFIQQAEPFSRGWYAGALGYLSPAKAEFCVTIRSAQIEKNVATIYAGAGIVEGSDPHLEWEEIERKAQSMLQLFNISN